MALGALPYGPACQHIRAGIEQSGSGRVSNDNRTGEVYEQEGVLHGIEKLTKTPQLVNRCLGIDHDSNCKRCAPLSPQKSVDRRAPASIRVSRFLICPALEDGGDPGKGLARVGRAGRDSHLSNLPGVPTTLFITPGDGFEGPPSSSHYNRSYKEPASFASRNDDASHGAVKDAGKVVGLHR